MPEAAEKKFDLTNFGLMKLYKKKQKPAPSLQHIQEDAGFYLNISDDLKQAGAQAAMALKAHYDLWKKEQLVHTGGSYRQNFFTIAVGGGNTVKSVYSALLEKHAHDIKWIQHVRFFFLEESTGENKWESSHKSLRENFILPLSDILIRKRGLSSLTRELDLAQPVDKKLVIDEIEARMVHGFDLVSVRKALRSGELDQAEKLVATETRRYQLDLEEKLGDGLALHHIISGIGKDGGIGAFASYNEALKVTTPGIAILNQASGAIRVALNRGVLVNADQIHLIISGSLKLRALGRFEMEDGDDFEHSVLETPIRMLRKNRKLAAKVHIFADDSALHFDEEVYSYRAKGESFRTKAEVREGLEEDSVHILLLHGFMGLYTYVNFLIRLPSAWTVSALRRGTSAKKMRTRDIFPHYAANLRNAILKNWKRGSPVPTGFHSIAGVISDHLLLAVAGRDGPIPAFERLNKGDRNLIEALRCAGMIHMATWMPSDLTHYNSNTKNLKMHKKKGTPLDFGGPKEIYSIDADNRLQLTNFDNKSIKKSTRYLRVFLDLPGAETMVNFINIAIRSLMDRIDLYKRRASENTPYALRLMSARMIKKVSFYGLFKELVAALHDPKEYQLRHIRALDAIIEYDIPYLSIIHEDDCMVSANRHGEEHRYLLARRLEKEGVDKEDDLTIPVRFVLAERNEPGGMPSEDTLNPHLMLMSTTREGEKLSRTVTSAITRFVNQNVHRATERGEIPALASVQKWVNDH